MSAAARQAGRARGAYAAEATLAIARGGSGAGLGAAGTAAGPGPRRAGGSADRGELEPGGREAERDGAAVRGPSPVRGREHAPGGEVGSGGGRRAEGSPVDHPRARATSPPGRRRTRRSRMTGRCSPGPPWRGWYSAPRSARPGRNGWIPRGPETARLCSAGPLGWPGTVSGDREGLSARSGRGRADPLSVRPRTPGGSHRPAHHGWLSAARGPGTPVAR